MLIRIYQCHVQVNHVTRWYKPWFYKHVETFLAAGEGEEYIPLREYLLRHDKVFLKGISKTFFFLTHRRRSSGSWSR